MTSAAMLANYESSIFESLKDSASFLFSEIRKLSPTKETEQEFEKELSGILDAYNSLSSVLGALYGIVDSKYQRLASSLENLKPGSAAINPNDVLTTYWETFNGIIENYISVTDAALDEIESTEHRRAILVELHTALLILRKQFVALFGKIEDLIEMIDIHDGLAESEVQHG